MLNTAAITLQDILDALLGNLGLLTFVLFILYAGYKKWWVFGWYAKEGQQREIRLEQRLDRALGTGEGATRIAQQATKLASERIEANNE